MNQNQFSHNNKSFLEELRVLYSHQKQVYTKNRCTFENLSTMTKKRSKQEKTRSKSKRKKIYTQKQVRKSSRINQNHNSEFTHQQINKQPIWQPKKRNKILSKQKKSMSPIIIKIQPNKNMKDLDPLYQFYSGKISSVNPLYQFCSDNSNNDQISGKSKDIFVPETSRFYPQQQIEVQKFMQSLIQSNYQQSQIQGWCPSKKQNSMLAIQKIIDEYLLFQTEMRNIQLAKMSDLIKYVRQIKGYYFTHEVLNDLLSINKKLYKIFVIQKQKHIKSCRLSPKLIQKRLLSTKVKMMRSQQNENKMNISE